MARGASSKQLVINKIMEIYPEAFLYNGGKELRIPFNEDGERVEIKVALSCAKTNVGGGDGLTESGEEPKDTSNAAPAPPSDEEKQNIANLMARLGL